MLNDVGDVNAETCGRSTESIGLADRGVRLFPIPVAPWDKRREALSQKDVNTER